MAGLELPVQNGEIFQKRSIDDCRALARPLRELLLGLYDLAGAAPFLGGQEEAARSLRKSLRTVQRNTAALVQAGLVFERRRQRGLNAVILLHPIVAAFAAAERHQPSRARYQRKAPQYKPARTAIRSTSLAMRVARIRRQDGRPFVPAPYLLELLTAPEYDACVAAANADTNQPLLGVPEVDHELRMILLTKVARERHRAHTLAWIAVGIGRDPFQMSLAA